MRILFSCFLVLTLAACGRGLSSGPRAASTATAPPPPLSWNMAFLLCDDGKCHPYPLAGDPKTYVPTPFDGFPGDAVLDKLFHEAVTASWRDPVSLWAYERRGELRDYFDRTPFPVATDEASRLRIERVREALRTRWWHVPGPDEDLAHYPVVKAASSEVPLTRALEDRDAFALVHGLMYLPHGSTTPFLLQFTLSDGGVTFLPATINESFAPRLKQGLSEGFGARRASLNATLLALEVFQGESSLFCKSHDCHALADSIRSIEDRFKEIEARHLSTDAVDEPLVHATSELFRTAREPFLAGFDYLKWCAKLDAILRAASTATMPSL